MTEQAKKTTAKIKLASREDLQNGQVALRFEPDYQDDRNKEWAESTPTLQISMNVKGAVAENFQPGAYTLTFEPSDD